jgi:outer membrane protein OmpA-like peptidoglycan-associated protein
MSIKVIGSVSFVLILGGALGCGAAAVPRELTSAREAYREAQASPAASLEPAQLYEAKKALTRAENAFEEDAESQETRDLAYVAQRKAERVKALGGIAYATRQIVQARRDYMLAQQGLQQKTEAELARTKQEAEAGKRGMEGQLAQGREQIAAERTARLMAEQRAKEAMDKLASVAQVRQEPQRGTIITLSGSVLFPTGQWSLLPTAQQKLDQVATALKESPDQNIVVEGYTDSTGTVDKNQELSLKRAQSVRDYLVSQGVPAERIRAEGRGPGSPIASNATPEGRANNRRVEIVIQPRSTVSQSDTKKRDAYE